MVRAVEAIDFDAGTVELRGLGVHPGQDPYHVHHGRARLDGSGVTWWTEGDGTHEISFSPDRRYIVDTWSRVDLPPVHELRRTVDGERVAELARADISALEALGWRAPERFVAPGRDGETEIWGFLLLPSNFDPTRRYPVVEQIYAVQGKGHSCGIYSFNDDHIHRLALTAPVSRMMVRQPQSKANAGSFTNGMPMTSSMGCGVWAGNTTNENISLKHYLNYTWVARPTPEDRPAEAELFGEFYNTETW